MIKKTNLVFVAHPDDEILGFGGTGAKLVQDGELVQPVILSSAVDARSKKPRYDELLEDIESANKRVGFENPILGDFPNLRLNNVDTVDLVKFIEKNIIEFNPNRIFTHHPSDLNDDHTIISKACLAAAKIFQRNNEPECFDAIYFMEIMSSSDWSTYPINGAYMPNMYVNIEDHLSLKIEALKCYRKVMRKVPHPRSEHAIKAIAAHRGAQSGFKFAESFQIAYRNLL